MTNEITQAIEEKTTPKEVSYRAYMMKNGSFFVKLNPVQFPLQGRRTIRVEETELNYDYRVRACRFQKYGITTKITFTLLITRYNNKLLLLRPARRNRHA
jgi:hypothetical protein